MTWIVVGVIGAILALWIYDAMTRKEYTQPAKVIGKSTMSGSKNYDYTYGLGPSNSMPYEDSCYLELQLKSGKKVYWRVNKQVYNLTTIGTRLSVKYTQGLFGFRLKEVKSKGK